MQKHMRIASFAESYTRFRKEVGMSDSEIGNVQAFRNFLDENNLKIDKKDFLHELYVVGKEVQEKNKENKMQEKIKLKKIDHCTYEGSDNKVYIRLSDNTMREALPEHNRETIKQQKMKNRFFSIGVIIVLLLMGGWNELYGNDTRVYGNDTRGAATISATNIPIYCTNGERILDYADSLRIDESWEQVYYLRKILFSEKLQKEEVLKIEKLIESYTYRMDGARYICVPNKGEK